MPQIVAELVIAIIAELDAETVEGAIVQAAEEAFHDIAGLEIEALKGRQELGVEAFG